MRLAILGATSQIARDFVQSIAAQDGQDTHTLVLYARRPQAVSQWLGSVGLPERYPVHDYGAFSSTEHFDAILNFVGIGSPVDAAAMGASIFDVTLQYDEIALNYVRQHPECRYIFLSSGAAYGGSFDAPVDANTKATVPINNLQPQDWYGVAKLHAECRHRALAPLPIVDIRVFNYFSHTQKLSARFLMTDILCAIRDNAVLKTSTDYIVRDFIHPSDFFSLVIAILAAPAINTVIDAYSKAPIDKPALLKALKDKFGLKYEGANNTAIVEASGSKQKYYSTNTRAVVFRYQPDLSSLEGILKESEQFIAFFEEQNTLMNK